MIDQIVDPVLRSSIAKEVAELGARRTFGLVDEECLAGAVGLPHAVVRRSSTVMFRDTASAHVWTVPEDRIGERLGTIAQTGGGESEVRALFADRGALLWADGSPVLA